MLVLVYSRIYIKTQNIIHNIHIMSVCDGSRPVDGWMRLFSDRHSQNGQYYCYIRTT